MTPESSILIVDDEPANLKLLRSMLAESGFSVRFATGGRMALDSVRASAPDLVLLDIDMPDLDGYEVCTRLKEDPATRDLPVVFISAVHDVAAKVRSFQVGGVDYISKPFQLEEVLARIRHHLTLHRQRAQIEAQAARLRELDALKSRFFQDISHEFRTPLMLTTGLVEAVRDGLRGALPPEARDDLDRAVSHAYRLEELIGQILDLSRLEAGVARLQPRRFDLVAHLDQLVASFAPLAERQRVTLRLVAPRPPLALDADAEALTKVVGNLLSNAFKHTRPGGRIDVVAHHEGPDHVAVAVRDTGKGIPPEVLPHVFDRFYIREVAGAHHQPGTGIGLALARELVQRHGGTLRAESREGEGSTFTLTLPLRGLPAEAPHGAQPDLAPPDLVNGAAQGDGRAGRAHVAIVRAAEATALATDASGDGVASMPDDEDRPAVLVVDDNAEVRRYLRARLSPSYRVLEAGDGREGLARVREHLPDLIVSDVQMPGMDGYALCRAVKTDPDLDFIPVVLLTVRADAGHRREGLETGADDYLTKPFDAAELLLRIENLIRSRQRLRERFETVRPPAILPEGYLTSEDDRFLERLHEVIGANLSNPDFTVEDLASAIAQDRTTLYRWIRRLLDQSPSEVIRSVRMQQGAALLAARAGTVSEIAYGVGFRSVQHFDRCFRKAYGVTPTAYMAQAEASEPAPGALSA